MLYQRVRQAPVSHATTSRLPSAATAAAGQEAPLNLATFSVLILQ